MKFKNVLLMGLSFVLVAVIAIGGTLAYLTINDQAKNNVFTVGNIDITLEETVGVEGAGNASDTEDGASFVGIMPGDNVKKEVTVTNTGKNPAYVAVTVTLKNDSGTAANLINSAIDDVYEKEPYNYDTAQIQAMYDYIFDGWGLRYDKYADDNTHLGMRLTVEDLPAHVLHVDSTKTTKKGNDTFMFAYDNWFKTDLETRNAANTVYGTYPWDGYYAADMGSYELNYTYYIHLDPTESTTLFNGLRVPAEFNAKQLAMFEGLEINIEASAIQSDNIPSTAPVESEEHAKAAFGVLAGEVSKAVNGSLESLLTADVLDEHTVTLPVEGNITWTTGASHGSTPLITADNTVVDTLIIEGGDADATTLVVGGQGVGPIGAANGATVVFRNMTIVDQSVSYAENNWEFAYLEFTGNLRFENCVFVNSIMMGNENRGAYATNPTMLNAQFINCTFNSNKDNEYAVWVSGANATFTDCTFEGARGLKVHEDYGSDVANVMVDGCTFNALSKKPGVAFGVVSETGTYTSSNNTSHTGKPAHVTIKNSTFIDCQPGDQDLYIYESDTTVTDKWLTLDNNTIINNGEEVLPENWITYADTEWYTTAADATAYTVDTTRELAGLAKLVNNGNTFKGKTVKLDADLNLNGKAWTPIGKSGATFQGHFDGQNHTISNVKCLDKDASDVGLFGFTTDGSVKNVNIHNATIKGYLNVGSMSGTPYTSTYDNITITGDVKIDGYAYVGGAFGKNAYDNLSNITINVNKGSYVKAESENYRTYVGGVVGFMGEGKITVSKVTSNIDVYGSTCDVGGITGIAHYNNIFTNCSSSGNVTITSYTDDGDQLEIGGIAGVWHNENGTTVTFTDCKYTGTLSAVKSDGTVYTGTFENNGLVGKAYKSSGTGTLTIN